MNSFGRRGRWGNIYDKGESSSNSEGSLQIGYARERYPSAYPSAETEAAPDDQIGLQGFPIKREVIRVFQSGLSPRQVLYLYLSSRSFKEVHL
jgi:hypothetical protein